MLRNVPLLILFLACPLLADEPSPEQRIDHNVRRRDCSARSRLDWPGPALRRQRGITPEPRAIPDQEHADARLDRIGQSKIGPGRLRIITHELAVQGRTVELQL